MRITLPTVDTTEDQEYAERPQVRKLSVFQNRSEPALPLILIALTLAMLLLVPYLIILDRLHS